MIKKEHPKFLKFHNQLYVRYDENNIPTQSSELDDLTSDSINNAIEVIVKSENAEILFNSLQNSSEKHDNPLIKEEESKSMISDIKLS